MQQTVVFAVGGEMCGIDGDAVCEVIQVQEVTTLPEALDLVDGFISLRGVIIPVVDFRKRFGYCSGASRGEYWIIVVNVSGKQVGLIVDSIIGMAELSGAAPVRSSLHTCRTKFLAGFGSFQGQKLSLVSPDKIVNHLSGRDSLVHVS